MKYFIGVISVIAIILVFALCPVRERVEEVEYLRIHIRANSNSVQDQNVKYKVKDAVVEALIPLVSEIESFDKAKKVISENFEFIESVADAVLCKEGLEYGSSATIKNEFFPTRTYEDLTLSQGNYDALILSLGGGEGDNWWCVVFPAFCFKRTTNSSRYEYISTIWEIIENINREEK